MIWADAPSPSPAVTVNRHRDPGAGGRGGAGVASPEDGSPPMRFFANRAVAVTLIGTRESVKRIVSAGEQLVLCAVTASRHILILGTN
jgi:hypothetical protein